MTRSSEDKAAEVVRRVRAGTPLSYALRIAQCDKTTAYKYQSIALSRALESLKPNRASYPKRNQALKVLHALGWTYRELGSAFGLAHQRVSQLIGGKAPKRHAQDGSGEANG